MNVYQSPAFMAAHARTWRTGTIACVLMVSPALTVRCALLMCVAPANVAIQVYVLMTFMQTATTASVTRDI